MWSEELMANNNRLFRYFLSEKEPGRGGSELGCADRRGPCSAVRGAVDFESLEKFTRNANEAQYRNSRDGAQKQSKSCRVTTSTATKVSHGEIRLVQQLRNLYLGL